MRLLITCIFACSFFACQQNELIVIDFQEETKVFHLNVNASGPTIEDQGGSFYTGFQVDSTFSFLYSSCLVGERGNALIIHLFKSGGTISNSPGLGQEIFRLQFWSDNFPSMGNPDVAIIDTLFVPGKVFPFGRGSGFVNLAYHLITEKSGNRLSQSNHLSDAVGELIILTVEPYEYLANAPGATERVVTGFNVNCRFDGEIGVVDLEEIESLVSLNLLNYRTNEKAYVSGEFEFFVEVN